MTPSKLNPRNKANMISNEKTFRLLFENHPIPMWVYDLKTLAFLDVNEAAVEKYGYTRDEFLALTIKDIRPLDDAPRLLKNVKQKRPPLQHSGQWRHKLQDGRLIDVEITSHTIEFKGRKAALVMAQDVTERLIAEKALAEREAQFRALFETAPIGIGVADTQGNLLAFNNAMLEPGGYSREDLEKIRNVSTLYYDQRQRDQALGLYQKQGALKNYPVQFKRKDGSPYDALISLTRTTFDGLPCIQAVVEDISERKQAEAALRESKLQLEGIFKTTMDAIVTVDEQQRIVIFNPAAEHIFGCPAGEVIGQTLYRFLPEYVRKEHGEYLHKFGRSNSTKRSMHTPALALTCLRANGEAFPSEVSISQIELGGKKLYTAIVRDITERKRADEALRHTNEALQALILASPVSIVVLDPDGKVKRWNPASESMFGWSEAEVLGRFLPYLPTGKLEEHRALRQRVLGGEAFTGIEVQRVKKDGSPIDISVSTAPLHDAEGNIIGIVGLNVNITERKHAEDALRESEELYHRLFENMLNGFAYCKILFEHGRPQDFIYLGVNSAFEALTGLRNVIGKKVSEVIPGIQESDPGLFEIYGRVALTGTPEKFETYVKAMQMWFSISVYCPQKEYFVAVFDVITERKRAEESLREAETKYRMLVERLPVIVYTSELGANGAWPYVSPQIEQLLGFTPQEWAADPDLWYRQVHPKDRDRQELLEEQAYARGESFVGEYRIFTRDGRQIWIRDSAQILPPQSGGLPIVQGVLMDITERKQAEQALRESQSQLSLFFHQSLDGFFFSMLDEPKEWNDSIDKNKVLDYVLTNQHITEANDAMLKQYGATRENFLGRTASDFFAHDIEQGRQFRRKLFDTGHLHVETDERKDDGTPIWIEGDYVCMYDMQNRITGIFGIQRDITARKRAEGALQQAEAKYRNIFENATEGIFQSSPAGKMLIVNPTLAHIMGYNSPEELIACMGDLDRDFYVQPARRAEFISQLNLNGTISGFESQVYRKDGGKIWISESARAVRDDLGQVQYYEGTLEDITERKRAEEKIRQQLDRLNALRDIDLVITSSMDLRLTMNLLLAQVTRQLKVDAAAILQFSPGTYSLEYVSGTGFRNNDFLGKTVQLGEQYAGKVAQERQAISVLDLHEESDPLLVKDGFVAYYGVPLLAKGQIKGVLEVFHRTPLSIESDWVDYLETLSGQAAIAMDNIQLFEAMQRSNTELMLAYDATIEGWSRALDLRDKETEGHTKRVTEMSVELGRAFGIEERSLTYIRWGGLLHDIGKMGIPDSILLKPDKLSDEEWVLMKKHPIFAYEMLRPIHYLRSALDIPYCHHEKWDGTGYPRGLKGDQIPLAARIFAVLDVYDALNSDRPYRKAWPREKILAHIKLQSGTHFDPKVVEFCLNSGVLEEGVTVELNRYYRK